jgi:hypothetical protein
MYRLLVGKPEGRRPVGRPRRRWLDNINMDLVQLGLGEKNAAFWDVTPSGSCKNRRFGGNQPRHQQGVNRGNRKKGSRKSGRGC